MRQDAYGQDAVPQMSPLARFREEAKRAGLSPNRARRYIHWRVKGLDRAQALVRARNLKDEEPAEDDGDISA